MNEQFAADQYDNWTENEYDLWAASEYQTSVIETVRAAYAKAVPVGETERSAYYDTTRYEIAVAGPGIDARVVRKVLANRDGHSMAAYGRFGGYSTIGAVTPVGADKYIVESVYHIGD